MATTSPWPLIHAEREALIADLGTLTDQQWATRSLCGAWTVRDVLGHMTAIAKMLDYLTGALARRRRRHGRSADHRSGAALTTQGRDYLGRVTNRKFARIRGAPGPHNRGRDTRLGRE